MQFNYRCRYFVVIIDANVYGYKYEKYKFDPPFLSFQAKNIFIGKSKVCPMTEFSGAGVKIDFDGITFLLECENNDYVFISQLEIFNFKTDDKIIENLSHMGNNMIPWTFAVGENYTDFLSFHYEFIQNDKNEEGTLLNATNDSSDPFDYQLGECGVDSFKTLEHSEVHTFYPQNEEDEEVEDGYLVEEDEENEDLIEANFCNGNNEMVEIFNQKCVLYVMKEIVFMLSDNVVISVFVKTYQIRGDIDLLKIVVCRP